MRMSDINAKEPTQGPLATESAHCRDHVLVELVDSIVAAVDASRFDQIVRLVRVPFHDPLDGQAATGREIVRVPVENLLPDGARFFDAAFGGHHTGEMTERDRIVWYPCQDILQGRSRLGELAFAMLLRCRMEQFRQVFR